MTYHSELTRNLVTFSEVPWLKITMNAKKKAFSQRKLNVQKLSQCIKMTKRIRIATDLSVFCLIYQNYMKGVCINKSMNILNHFYHKFQCGLRQRFSAQHYF